MKRSVRIFWRIFLIGFSFFILLILAANFGLLGKMPSIDDLQNPEIQQASEVLAIDGTLMGKYYTEKGNRTNVKYRDISPNVINALIATEDERFYDHSGIDFRSSLRALMTLGSQGGGSTITQQLALNLFNERSTNKFKRMFQKLKEWIIAVKLERNFTKEEIITLYLNAVPFGNNIYGIRNASRTFFQKEPDQLKVEEAAMLVGMLKGNSIYNPIRNPVAARDRRNVVIGQMVANKYISEAEGEKLKKLPIQTNYRKMDENTGYAPYFREVLKDEIKDLLKDVEKPNGDKYDIYQDGLKIYTTINPIMQEYAEEAVAIQLPVLQRNLDALTYIKNGKVWKGHENRLEESMKASDRWKNMEEDGFSEKEIRAAFQKKVQMKVFAWNSRREKDTTMTPFDSIKYHRQMVQTAFMVMDPITGEVKAWVGGVSFKTFKLDHANMRVKRQVGSSIKPLLYAEAMEDRNFSPETEVQDVQQDFGHGRMVPATTRSCTGRTMTMASALAYSKNCASAFIMKNVGPDEFVDFINNRINIPTKLQPNPSNALGACELSLFEMMWGYSVFAGRGFSTKPYFVSRIEDRNGNIIKQFDYSVNRKEAINEVTAYRMARMMEGTVTRGTAAGLMGRLGATEMAGKTGTTNDNADAWFMGYTPQLLAGAWVGCDDPFIRNESSGGFGGAAARPIWEAFFKKVYGDKTLGIDQQARFIQPAKLDELINSADLMELVDPNIKPGAEGENTAPAAEDYLNNDYIGPESKPVIEEDIKRDTVSTRNTPIGAPAEEPKKKKGFFKRIFGKKDKDGDG
jgi:penicillin-binding protein 1A